VAIASLTVSGADGAGVGASERGVALAVETPLGADLLIFAGGEWHMGGTLQTYPDGDESFFSIKTAAGEVRSRHVSPDGGWFTSARLLPSAAFFTSHLSLYRPAKGP